MFPAAKAVTPPTLPRKRKKSEEEEKDSIAGTPPLPSDGEGGAAGEESAGLPVGNLKDDNDPKYSEKEEEEKEENEDEDRKSVV